MQSVIFAMENQHRSSIAASIFIVGILQVESSVYICWKVVRQYWTLFVACVDEEVQGDKAADRVTLLSHLICLWVLFTYNHGFNSYVNLWSNDCVDTDSIQI